MARTFLRAAVPLSWLVWLLCFISPVQVSAGRVLFVVGDGAVGVGWSGEPLSNSTDARVCRWPDGMAIMLAPGSPWLPDGASASMSVGSVSHSVGVAWLPAWMVVMLPPCVGVIRELRRPKPGRCVRCRYDLSGAPAGCPECGAPAA